MQHHCQLRKVEEQFSFFPSKKKGTRSLPMNAHHVLLSQSVDEIRLGKEEEEMNTAQSSRHGLGNSGFAV
jgi:hypothetical protein